MDGHTLIRTKHEVSQFDSSKGKWFGAKMTVPIPREGHAVTQLCLEIHTDEDPRLKKDWVTILIENTVADLIVVHRESGDEVMKYPIDIEDFSYMNNVLIVPLKLEKPVDLGHNTAYSLQLELPDKGIVTNISKKAKSSVQIISRMLMLIEYRINRPSFVLSWAHDGLELPEAQMYSVKTDPSTLNLGMIPLSQLIEITDMLVVSNKPWLSSVGVEVKQNELVLLPHCSALHYHVVDPEMNEKGEYYLRIPISLFLVKYFPFNNITITCTGMKIGTTVTVRVKTSLVETDFEDEKVETELKESKEADDGSKKFPDIDDVDDGDADDADDSDSDDGVLPPEIQHAADQLQEALDNQMIEAAMQLSLADVHASVSVSAPEPEPEPEPAPAQ